MRKQAVVAVVTLGAQIEADRSRSFGQPSRTGMPHANNSMRQQLAQRCQPMRATRVEPLQHFSTVLST